MVAAFTTPILSVAADAVRDLDGREALSGLWAVFTKCKGSLQNGPRLENIAWRLWHQEMKGSNREPSYNCEDHTRLEKDVYDEKSTYRPPTPSEILNLPPPYPELPSAPTAASSLPAGGLTPPPKPLPAPSAFTFASPPPPLTPTTPLHTRRLSSTSNRRSSFMGGSPRSVGKIICDLVPTLSPTSGSHSSSSNSSSSDLLMGASLARKPLSHSIISEPPPPSMKMSTIAPSFDGSRPSSISLSEVKTSLDANAVSCLPTPEMEETELSVHATLHSSYSSQSPATRAPHQAIPQSSLSDIPSSISASDTFSTTVTSAASTTHTFDSASLSGQSSQPQHVLSEPLARFSDMDVVPSHTLSQFTPFVNILQPPTPTLPTAPQPSQMTNNLHTQPPRLVVVHPTPNPTPHPTPPTTPLINGVMPLAGHRAIFLSPPSMNGPPRQQAYTLLEEEFPSSLNLPGLSGFSILDHEGAQSGAGFVGEPEVFDRSMVTNQEITEAASSAMGDYTLRPANILMDSSTATTTANLAALLAGQGMAPAYTSDEIQRSPTKRDSSRKPRKRHSRSKSGSSIASKTSEVSNTTSRTSASNRSSISGITATSTAFSSDMDPYTLNGQLNGFADDNSGQLRSDMGGLDSATVAALKRLGSLSTIHSSSTLGRREDALQSLEGKEKDMQMVLVSDDEFDDEDDEPPTPLSPVRPHQSAAASKKLKRNSAPPKLTSTALALSPTSTTQGNRSPSIARSSSTVSSKRKARTVSSAAISRQSSNGRSSSRGRSTGEQEDVNDLSHQHSNNFADLANLGIPGMTIVAAAYPPSAAATSAARKQLTVGAASKARSRTGKAVRARGVVRRNSAGPGVDLGGVVEPVVEVLEQKIVGGQMGQLERQASQRVIQTGFDEYSQVPPNDRRASEPALHSQTSVNAQPSTLISTANLGVGEPLVEGVIAASPEEIPAVADTPAPGQQAKTLAASDQSSNPPHRPGMFNIGSNSDEGKSAGSGSSISGAHSLGQRYTAMMGQQPNGVKVNGRLVVDETKLKARLVLEEERQRREENELRHHQQELMRQQQEVHLLQQEEIKRQNEAQLMALNQPRVLGKAEMRQLQMMQLFHNQQQQISKASSKPPSRQASAVHVVQPRPENERISEKAKGKAKAVASPPSSKHTKNKSKSTPNLANLDPDLAAKVRDSLAEPLLPKGRPVVVDMESEFETDSDEGSWSSAAPSDDNETQKQQQYKRELSLQQERARQEAAGRLEQEQLVRQLLQQNERAQQAAAPPAIQRTHSANLPATNQSKQTKSTNQRSRQAQAVHHAKLEQAAKEAQRQRDMIKKVPTESYQDLAQARANSVGLLSQLLNPNPNIFPPNHPYRRGYSQGNIRPTVQPMQPTTSEPGPSRPSAPKGGPAPKPPPAQTNPPPLSAAPSTTVTSNPSKDNTAIASALSKLNDPHPTASKPNAPSATQRSQNPRRHASTDDSKKRASRSGLSSPIKAPPMPFMKSAAAMPVSSVVQAGSFAAKRGPVAPTTASTSNATMTSPGGYRPRGPPKDQEMDDDSGSEAESGTIPVPTSVAEQRLKALAQKRGIRQPQTPQPPPVPSKQAADDDVPEWARVSLPHKQHPPSTRRVPHDSQLSALAPQPARTAPIPLGHPYNLPPPAPPTTPRTTRRQMLSTELSESLRRNLLWERQITKNGTVKRTASGGGSRHNVLNGVQPFTGMPRVVKLHVKGTVPPGQLEDPTKPFPDALTTDQERDEMRKHAMARNRSWANDYPHAGW